MLSTIFLAIYQQKIGRQHFFLSNFKSFFRSNRFVTFKSFFWFFSRLPFCNFLSYFWLYIAMMKNYKLVTKTYIFLNLCQEFTKTDHKNRKKWKKRWFPSKLLSTVFLAILSRKIMFFVNFNEKGRQQRKKLLSTVFLPMYR